jgi:hypothetical protein
MTISRGVGEMLTPLGLDVRSEVVEIADLPASAELQKVLLAQSESAHNEYLRVPRARPLVSAPQLRL